MDRPLFLNREVLKQLVMERKFKNVDELSDVCEVFVLSNISILQNLQLTCNCTVSE